MYLNFFPGEEPRDMKMQAVAITKRSILLQKYLENNVVLELQALYALQALVDKLDHPRGTSCTKRQV